MNIRKLLIIIICFVNFGFSHIKTIKDSFVFVTAGFEVVRKKETSYFGMSYYQDLTEINKTLKSLNFMSASSFVLAHKNKGTFVSTSGHVCKAVSDMYNFESSLLLKAFVDGVKQTMTEDPVLFEMFYEIKPVLLLTDYYGKQYNDNLVVSVDKTNDLCVMFSNNIIGKPVEFEHKCNEEKIYNISTSGGFYLKNGVPLREGFLNRRVEELSYNNDVKFKNFFVYSLYVLPGSSGSAVFNSKGKVCGNINLSQPRLEISYGASSDQIVSHFQKYLNDN